VERASGYCAIHKYQEDNIWNKMSVLSESKSGYIWNMISYCGKVIELKGSKNLGYTSKVVLTLYEEILVKGYTIYVDNF
jgi:hypothetical protein